MALGPSHLCLIRTNLCLSCALISMLESLCEISNFEATHFANLASIILHFCLRGLVTDHWPLHLLLLSWLTKIFGWILIRQPSCRKWGRRHHRWLRIVKSTVIIQRNPGILTLVLAFDIQLLLLHLVLLIYEFYHLLDLVSICWICRCGHCASMAWISLIGLLRVSTLFWHQLGKCLLLVSVGVDDVWWITSL